MGVWGDLGKAALQSFAQGVADAHEKRKREEATQSRQEFMQQFIANEREIQAAGEKGDLECIQVLAGVYYQQGDYQKAIY